MIVQQLKIFHADIPFRFAFKHTAAERAVSETIFVKLTLDNGIVGWGEGLPRPYVTGETVVTALNALRGPLGPLILGRNFETIQDVQALAQGIADASLPGESAGGIYFGAARCALEIALLDAASKSLGEPFCRWLGPLVRRCVYATAVIPDISSKGKLLCLLWLIKGMGFKAVKVKVGTDHDEETLSLVRSVLGRKIPLLIDANGAWSAREALDKLLAWKRFNIRLVEQPVAAGDLAGMRQVRESSGLDVMADESLRSIRDAEALISAKACTMFNIRLSKCGGVLPSWRILTMARRAGVGCQLGCQVGESSVLAAAGRCFALCAQDLLFFEGGYGKLLLRRDVAGPPVILRWKGCVKDRTMDQIPGLGIHVDETLLKSYVKECVALP